MSQTNERRNEHRPVFNFAKVESTLAKNRLLWIGPTVIFSLAGIIFTLVTTQQWKATQALVVRDEAISEIGLNQGAPLGRFDSNDSLKRSLETILQIAKNQSVAGAALTENGPDPHAWRKEGQAFPTPRELEKFIDRISVSAPKGTEFGTSEVVYLSVTASTPERAINLASSTCDQLEQRLQKLRNDDAQSIIAELQEKKDLAQRELDSATQELSALEAKLGADLGEMRTLSEAGSAGESNLRTQLNQIKDELRQAESSRDLQQSLLSLLKEIGTDTDSILATPNRLLDSQPALRRLKDGLVDAQLRTARLRGGLTATHPRVQAAIQNERNIQKQLVDEVKHAIASTESEIGVGNSLTESLQEKLAQVQAKLDHLAARRAEYVNLTAKVSQCREQRRTASLALTEAKGRQEASATSSLITRLDEPFTGSRPVSPGTATVIGGSFVGGLVLGLSLVYLVAPWQEARGGRRSTDHPRRRATDGAPPEDRRSTREAVSQGTTPTQSQPENSPAPETDGPSDNVLDHLTKIARSQ